ncbi:efflux RND transporter permease subunit [Marispirochaeta sp.]|uniref:efflux RND transporter permease subunit n=1 Tax=Marispirochaeta sp. TaxID=2038653 RepID=UPI0029C67841|nr:efflux RND transporter permease subunit [Marispirochaeta sp.]
MLKTLIHRPLTVLTVFVLLTLLGLFMVNTLPVDLFPDTDLPVIYILTTYDGAGPEEVESELTDPLEDQFYTLESLESITSTSSEGSSAILLEFAYGTDLEEIKNDMRDKIDRIKNALPDGADEPIMMEFDPNEMPILTVSLQGDLNIEELYTLAEDLVQPGLEQVPDVSNVDISGGRDRIVAVTVSARRLDALGLDVSTIGNALASQNLSMGAGSATASGMEYQIRTSGKINNLEAIRNTLITRISSGGEVHKLHVRDVADVDYANEEESSRVYQDGLPAVELQAYKKTGANTIQVADNLKEALGSLTGQLPAGVRAFVVSDESTVISDSLNSVLNSALTGVLAAVVILMIFLRQLKSTLIIAITIPVSILITVMGMSLGGLTFNLVALTGLTLGVGMIVDNSIVIIENIFSHREKGERLTAAGLFGTKEMINAITASTLTTISVFLPIVLFKDDLGFLGNIFGSMGFTVIVALLSSLFVAILLVPVLATHYLEIHVRGERPVRNPLLRLIDGGIEATLTWISRGYHHVLNTALRHKLLTVLSFTLILAVALLQIPKLGLSLQPEGMSETIQVNMKLPLGSSLDTTEEVLDRFQAMTEEKIGDAFTSIGMTVGARSNSYQGSLTILLPDLQDRTLDTDEIRQRLRSLFPLFPEASFSFGGRMGPMASGDLNIQVRGDNLITLMDYAENARELIAVEVPELTEISLDMEEGLPQWDIIINREKLFDLGLDVSSATKEMYRKIHGYTATTFTDFDDESYDVIVRLSEKDRQSIRDLENVFVLNTAGDKIPVSSFAVIQDNSGPTKIPHTEKKRTITISGDLVPGAQPNFVEAQVRDLLEQQLPPDPGIEVHYKGEMEDISETGGVLLKILAIAVLLVFGVMVSQFESLRAPFIIILAMPMLSIGVIGIFLIMGLNFDMIALIGVVMLAGMVVNNGIVLVDYIGLLRKRGSDLHTACLEGGVSRLRPILMTTLTTIATMVPLAFFAGEGGARMQGLALTVVGGLSVNTLITLVFVPVLYAIFFHNSASGKKEIQL